MIWEEVEFEKQDSNAVRNKRNIYRKHYRKQFIEKLYASGELNILGKDKQSARYGKLPQMYNIHHKTPLSLAKDGNDFDNFTVIDVDIHNLLNETTIDPQTDGKRQGTLFLPVLPNVVTKKNSKELYERLLEAKERIR
jgi:hypothetical protein